MQQGAEIQDYYDANTRRFLLVGGSGDALAIHRPLWGPGVRNAVEAAAYVNTVIRGEAARHLGRAPRAVCDLGCGVGGTLFHLAGAWPEAALTGVTISAVQKARAEAEATRRGLSARCTLRHTDFTAEPLAEDAGRADLAIAVEAHVHAQSADAFLKGAARYITPGGLLIVVDDMAVRDADSLSAAERRLLDRFQRGWRLGHVPTRAGLRAAARKAGFQALALRDLTPMIRLDRLRDRVLHIVAPAAQAVGLNRWPIFGNMIGGDALTRMYRLGTLGYTCMVMRKAA